MNYQSVFKARNRIGKGTFTQAYKYLPAITRLEYLDDGSAVYSMPFYNKLTKHHKEAWKQYKILQHFFNHYNYDTEKILLNVDKLKVSTGLKNSLIRLIEMMANYNHYEYIKLELPRNNLGVTKSGRLILLDIIFDVELLRITRKS